MSCDSDEDPGSCSTKTGFQSLSGFLMSCDGPTAYKGRPYKQKFQSLSGFLMSCDPERCTVIVGNDQRFNPYRVF